MKNLFPFILIAGLALGSGGCKPKETARDESLILAGVGFDQASATPVVYKYPPGNNFKDPVDSTVCSGFPYGNSRDTIRFSPDNVKFKLLKENDYKLVVGNNVYRITGINVSGNEAMHATTENVIYYGIVSCNVNGVQYLTMPHKPQAGFSTLIITM